MKKLTSLLLAVVVCLSVCSVLTSCDEEEHTHAYETKWSNDSEYHWYACKICNKRLEKAAHIWDEGEVTSAATADTVGIKTFTCTVCGQTKNESLKYIEEPKEEDKEDYSWLAVFLPDEIVCAVGRTIEIYNAQVCPLAEKYHFRWDCSVGKALERKFSITGTESLIGSYDLKLYIYNDKNEEIFHKTSTLKIVDNELEKNITIVPIGDSLTNNKYWLTEVKNISGDKISYVGTRSSLDAQANPVSHEGRSGWDTNSYLTASEYTYEGEGVHPFWNPTDESFSWSYYKSNSGLNPDGVQIFLGTNELSWESADVYAENMKTLVDIIREDDPEIPIFIVLPPIWGDQNGMGVQQSSDGFASNVGRYKYDQDIKFIEGAKALYETLKEYDRLYFVPITQCHDSEYNYGAVETPVNPRATQTELMPEQAVHPTKQGYEQMADIMYSVYCQAFE